MSQQGRFSDHWMAVRSGRPSIFALAYNYGKELAMKHYPEPADPSIALCGASIDSEAEGPDCGDCELLVFDLGLPELP